MDSKTRWLRTLRYEPVDHPPLVAPGPWPTTLRRWEAEGLPKGADLCDYFGIEPGPRSMHVLFRDWLYPPFEERVVEGTGEYVVRINHNGVLVRELREGVSMPEFLRYPVSGPGDLGWIRERLRLETPGRVAPDWLQDARRRQSDTLLFVNGGMYFGFLNEHTGTEALMYAYADCPEFVHAVNDAHCALTEQTLATVLPHLRPDFIGYHEDMAYKTASIISPAMFREFMAPYYRRVTRITAAHGIDIHYMDSDGNVAELIPLWLECGINLVSPLEAAAGMDPVRLRHEYGRELLMIGGFDKRILAAGKADIRRELERLWPVVEQGGYIPTCDHGWPHDIPFANACCYMETLKSLCGVR
jgi:uroporphyrinogen decarboxylase